MINSHLPFSCSRAMQQTINQRVKKKIRVPPPLRIPVSPRPPSVLPAYTLPPLETSLPQLQIRPTPSSNRTNTLLVCPRPPWRWPPPQIPELRWLRGPVTTPVTIATEVVRLRLDVSALFVTLLVDGPHSRTTFGSTTTLLLDHPWMRIDWCLEGCPKAPAWPVLRWGTRYNTDWTGTTHYVMPHHHPSVLRLAPLFASPPLPTPPTDPQC